MIFEELEKEQSFLFYNSDAVFPALTEEMFELAALLALEVLPWGEMRRVGDSTFALWHFSRHSPGTKFWGRCSAQAHCQGRLLISSPCLPDSYGTTASQ